MGLKPILQIPTATPCYKFCFSRCHCGRYARRILGPTAQKNSVCRVSWDFYSACWRMQKAQIVRLRTSCEHSRPYHKVGKWDNFPKYGLLSNKPYIASALGLFEPDQPSSATSYATLIQNFNRFLLEQIQSDMNSDAETLIIRRNYTTLPSTMQQIFGLQLQAISTCQCNAQNARDTYPFVVDMSYNRRV